jgi:hypothetical protein
MNFAKFLLVATLLFSGAHTSSAAVRIAGDRGGHIGRYIDRFAALRTSGEIVIIDGPCLSACTMVLGDIPHDKNLRNIACQFGFPRGV